MRRRLWLWAIVIAVGSVPTLASAASLSLAPTTVTIPAGETVTISLLLDPETDRVNTVQGAVNFSTVGLELISVSTTDSAIVYWGRSPTSETPGRVTFLGGIPNPGVSGDRANLFDVTVRGRLEGSYPMTIEAATVLADDGEGTDVLTVVSNATVVVQAPPVSTTDVPSIDDSPTDAPVVTGSAFDALPRVVAVPSNANLLETFQVAGTAYAGDRVEIKLGTNTLSALELPDVDGARAQLGILTPVNWTTEVTAPLRPGAYEFKIESVAPDGTRRSSAVQTLTVHGSQIAVGQTVLPTAVFFPAVLAVVFAVVVGNVLVIGRLLRASRRAAGIFQRVDRELVALRARVDAHTATTAELDQLIDAIDAELPPRRRPAEHLPRD